MALGSLFVNKDLRHTQPRDDQLLLIRQTDHADLAGRFAEHWSGGPFAAPWPRGPLVVAARHHDDGWLRWEAAPRVDPATHRPYQFTDLPVAEHLDFYQWGIDRGAVSQQCRSSLPPLASGRQRRKK